MNFFPCTVIQPVILKQSIPASRHRLGQFLSLCILLCPCLLKAQSDQPISLADTQQVQALADIAPDLLYTDIDSFFQVVDYADSLLQELKQTFAYPLVSLEGQVVTQKVKGYSLIGKYGLGIHRVKVFLASPTLLNSTQNSSTYYNLLGNLYVEKGDFKEAKRVFFHGLSLNPSPQVEASILNNLGNLDYYLGTYTSAASYYKKVLRRENDIDLTPSQLASIRLNLGAVYMELDSLILAERQMKYALQLIESLPNSGLSNIIYLNLSQTYFRAGKLQKAKSVLDSSLIHSRRLQDHSLLTQIYLLKAQNFIDAQQSIEVIKKELVKAEKLIIVYDLDEFEVDLLSEKANFATYQAKPLLAEQYYLSALKQAIVLGDFSLQASFYKNLATVNSLLGNMALAYSYHLQFHHLTDSLRAKKDGETINTVKLKVDLATSKQEEEEDQMRLDLISSQTLSINRFYLLLISISILLIVIMALVIIIRQRNRIQKISEKLDNQNQRLKNLFQERQLILKLITHDLRTLLMHIQTLIANMQTNLKDEHIADDSLQKDLSEIDNSASDINKLATQILESDHIIYHGEKDRPKPIDLNQQLLFAVDRYRSKAYNKQIDVKFSPLSSPAIHVSHQQGLQLILENLVSNALKYTPPKSEVEIRLVKEGESYQFYIRDHGPGFTEADFEKIFQRFQPLSAKPTGAETAYGMGLYLAKKLSNQLGLLLEIENHPEEGAVARLTLPSGS